MNELITNKSRENQQQDLNYIELFKADKNNFKLIYDKYFNYIKHYISSKFGYNENVDDFTIEIMTKIYERIDGYDENNSNFSTWITKISYNYMIDYKRGSRSIEFQNIDDIRHVLDCEKNSSVYNKFTHENNLTSLITKENHKILRDVLNVEFSGENLADVKMKEFVDLFYYKQMGYNEISELTSENLGTIKCYLFRAKERMRNHIKRRNINLV